MLKLAKINYVTEDELLELPESEQEKIKTDTVLLEAARKLNEKAERAGLPVPYPQLEPHVYIPVKTLTKAIDTIQNALQSLIDVRDS